MPSANSAVSGNKEEGYTFTCPLDVFGRPHKEPAPACGFTSNDHPVKAVAVARGEAHFIEHETGEPMSELIEVYSHGQYREDKSEEETS